jgi:hypothetical protein
MIHDTLHLLPENLPIVEISDDILTQSYYFTALREGRQSIEERFDVY